MDEPLALIERYCREGDHGAFRSFYREQSHRLWRFLVARGCGRDDAYDLLSEAFLRFVQSVCKDPRSPVALLYRIAINLHIDSYRRQQTAAIDPHADPEAELDASTPHAADARYYVRALVRKLPEGEQNLLLMRYWLGLTHKEIAQALDLPEGTVRRRCTEVLGGLRERWGKE